MARHRVRLLLALGALASTAAFVVPLPPGHERATYAVTATDFKYKIVPARVKAGRNTFRVVNRGEATHDFKIAGKKTQTPEHGPARRRSRSRSRRVGAIPTSARFPATLHLA